MSPFYLGQLRHLYTMMLAGEVTDTAEAARGLLGPAIADEERAAEAPADLGPVLDALVAACDAPATDEGMAAIALRLVELRTAWTTARAKLVTT